MSLVYSRRMFFAILIVFSLLVKVRNEKIENYPFRHGPISVGNSALHLPIDYGLSLLTLVQNTDTKEMLKKSVKGNCATNIDWFFENLMNVTDDGMWALKMIDATAKIPSGILKLNLGGWMGNFDQCLEIKSEKRGIMGNYCFGTLYIDIGDPSGFVSDHLMLTKAKLFAEKKANFQNAFPTAGYPSFGICIPDGCDEEDLQGVVQFLNLSFNVPFECQTAIQANPPLTAGAWAVIAFFLFIVITMVASTAYDVNCEYNQKEPSHVLSSFSVYTNGKKLFAVNKNSTELSCLNGIRVLSMIWVIVGHTLSVTITGPLVNTSDVLKFLDTTESMIFANAVHSVDTFMMITGLLVVYGYLKSKHMGLKFNILVFYLHRYIRLTPPYLAVILVSMSLLQYMGSGPHWSFVVNYFQDFCQKNWWSALLYLQNYINVEQWCVGQTWYLNIDWQLYLCAPILLLSLTWKPKVGLTLMFLALVTFLIVPFYVTWVNELPALITNLNGDLTNYQNLYYLKTHTRASPWFVGAFVGYIIAKIKFDSSWPVIKFNKIVLLSVWAAVLALLNICIFMGHDNLTSQEYHKFTNAFYNSLVRPTWAACIGWIVFACANGFGGVINRFLSLPIFQVLNRFTYSMYLLHVTMLYMIISASKTPTNFSLFHIAYSFWGITMLTLALSVFWVLAFESPVLALEKYLLGKHRTRKPKEDTRQPAI